MPDVIMYSPPDPATRAGPGGPVELLMEDAAHFSQASCARRNAAAQTRANRPVLDDARVAGIRAALAAGSYTIDAQRIAARLLEFEALTRRS